MSPTLENRSHDGDEEQLHVEVKSENPKPQSSPPVFHSSAASNAASPLNGTPRKTPTTDPLDALRALPEVRPIPFVEGRELPIEKSVNSPRSQTRSAFLLSTRGKVREPPCTHCTRSVGRFTHCISLSGWFHGACATCQMASRGNLCSLRLEAEGSPKASSVPASQPQPEQQTAGPSQTPIDLVERPTSSLKRKRPLTIAPLAPETRPHVFHAHPDQTSSPANLQTPAYAANFPPDATLQGRTREQASPLQHGPQSQLSHGGMRRQYIQPQPSNIPQGPAPMHFRPASSHSQVPISSDNRGGLSLTISTSAYSAIASQNQPYRSPYTQQTFNESRVQLPNLTGANGTETPIIDTLSRRKQKQIFSIIGGLQSGIRSARQQADNMQKQLDSLQSLLGIDGDEDEVENMTT